VFAAFAADRYQQGGEFCLDSNIVSSVFAAFFAEVFSTSLPPATATFG
jgi:hypothetical protein